MPAQVRGFVHKSLRLPQSCELLRRSVDRPNIYIMPEDIPKTMVFTDSLRETCRITTNLSNRVPKNIADIGLHLVLEYSTAITYDRRAYNLELFASGECRVLVCTEACGMGVNIPDVERVIQWRISTSTNLSNIYQRLGRAARKPNVQGLGIIFHTNSALITPQHSPEAQIYRRSWNHPRYHEVLTDIIKFDMGLVSCTAGAGKKRKIDGSTESHTEIFQPQEELENGQPGNRNIRSKALPLTCRATLSMVNTTECRRRVILRYFAESPPPLQYEYPCCDRCMGDNIPPEILRLMPPIQKASAEQVVMTKPLRRGIPKLSSEYQAAVRSELRAIRTRLWFEQGGPIDSVLIQQAH
ncbi:P-loop containing nucleoside triphosphate hydrolase protein [Kalaharituber pfeilii]|nr:P-loop containing nucleoside triphosphate hydrolase protein [Kalaharituber pfeilii]